MFRVFVAGLLLIGLSLTSQSSFAQQTGCVMGNCQNGKGTRYLADGDRYEGDFRFGARDGNGTLFFADGHRYEGEFADDKRHGKGTFHWTNGDRYEGDFVDDERHGKGVYYFYNGNRYEGDFVENVPSGIGTYYFSNGNRYEGDFAEGKRHGNGALFFSSGNRYEGEFADDKRHGKGTFHWTNGDRYEGGWIDDKMAGRGTVYLADGSIDQQGIWKDNQFVQAMALNEAPKQTGCVSGNCVNGKGTIYSSNGDRYEGDFVGGKGDGKGVYYFSDGSRYEGDFVQDKMAGKGTFHYAGGERYEGNWVNNKRTGKGIFYFPSGERYEGDFVDDKMNGKGSYYFKGGSRYEGDFVGGKANGKGTLYNSDGSIDSQGIWKDNQLVQTVELNETPKPSSEQASEVVTLAANELSQRQLPQIAPDTQPPEITMQRGINVVAKARHTVRGKATDTSGVAIVEVNGFEAALDADGNFSVELLLAPGGNEITIAATDTYKNTGSKTFSITREASAPMLAPQMSSIETGEYHALLIGVNEYESTSINSLSEPVKDATALRNVLVNNYSFDASNVKQLTNPTRGEILDELDRLAERLTKNDNLLIFYAGHGYWDEGRNEGYWLPSDAEQNRRRDWVSNATVVSAINGIKTQHTLLISDACFSGGIFETRRAFNNIPPATESLYDLPSRKAMTSGTLNEVPDRSVFIEYLIQRLEDNEDKYATSQDLFTRLRTAVINNSPTRQVPQFGEIRETGDEGGDFIFVRR